MKTFIVSVEEWALSLTLLFLNEERDVILTFICLISEIAHNLTK